jgi:hypothetical protein
MTTSTGSSMQSKLSIRWLKDVKGHGRPRKANLQKPTNCDRGDFPCLSRILFVAVSILLFGSAARAERDPIRLTHGPMLGNPTAHSMSVWARTSDAGEFAVRIGSSPQRLDRTRETAVTRIEHDNTGVAHLGELESDTRYHYQVWVNCRPHGWPGSFHTLPDAEDTQNLEWAQPVARYATSGHSMALNDSSGLSTLSLLVVDRCRCGRWLVGIAAQVFRVETPEFYASVSRCELPIYLAVNLVA